VELDFTYYRMPTADQLKKLASRTPDSFQFAVKAHQDITHNRGSDLGPFAQFRAALAPLQGEGKLGAVLLQFPNAFRNVDENVEYLGHCFDLLPDLPLIVEFRRDDWLTQHTLQLLRERGVGFCNVDLPRLPGLLPKTSFVTAPTAYVRFHGRNAKTWWKHEHAWQRYSYSYSDDELQEWVPHLQEMGEQAKNLYAFANNHWQGQSVATIKQLRLLMDRPAVG